MTHHYPLRLDEGSTSGVVPAVKVNLVKKGQTVSCTSVFRNSPELSCENGGDGDVKTLWTAGSTSAWWTVDLQKPGTQVGSARIHWGNVRGNTNAQEYSLEASDDQVTWTQFFSTHAGHKWRTMSSEAVAIRNLYGAGRYVRLKVSFQNELVSVGEIELFSPPPPVNLVNGRPIVCNHETSNSPWGCQKTGDGDLNTRWDEHHNDGLATWWIVDLQEVTPIRSARIVWNYAGAKGYKLQASSNLKYWTDFYMTTSGKGGVETLENFYTRQGVGRYVRLVLTERGSPYIYSIWEVELFSSAKVGGNGRYTTDDTIAYKSYTNDLNQPQ